MTGLVAVVILAVAVIALGLDGRDVILGVAGDRGVLGFLVLGGGYPPRVASVVALVVLAVTAEAL